MSQSEPAAESSSFEESLAPLLDRAYGLAYTLTRNPTDAEDLLQEAALRGLRRFETFELGTNFRAWFYRLLVNCHYERHRQTRRRPSTVELDDVEVGELYLYRRTAEAGLHELGDDPARMVMSKLTTEQVMGALAELPEEYRVVAQLCLAQELSYQEAAEALGCPTGTVRSRLHRARRMLQRSLWHIAVQAGVVSQLTERRLAS